LNSTGLHRTTRTIAALTIATAVMTGCSSSKHSSPDASSSPATVDGGGTGAARTTASAPTVTDPSIPNWVKAHAVGLRALKTAVLDVNAAFQANDAAAKKTALVECANAAAPLARSTSGSLPNAQATAITTISDGCATMTHDLKSGDAAAVDSGKTAFDKAVLVVTPLFP
jgi:hypothetical protein